MADYEKTTYIAAGTTFVGNIHADGIVEVVGKLLITIFRRLVVTCIFTQSLYRIPRQSKL